MDFKIVNLFVYINVTNFSICYQKKKKKKKKDEILLRNRV